MKGAVFAALLLLAAAVSAYYVSDHLETHDDFTLCGRFCFSTMSAASNSSQPPGLIHINQTAIKYTPGKAWWALYYDSPSQWDANYKNKSRACMDKRIDGQSFSVRDQLSIELKPHDYVRPHIWYVVLLNCPPANMTTSEVLDINYTIHFVDQDGDEIGYDEHGLLALNVVYFVFFILVGAAHGAAVFFLFRKGVAHPIVLILAGVIVLIILSLFFVVIHWGVYYHNGIGAPGCRVFGQLLMGLANIVFAVLLIAIASGWAITYHDLPRKLVILIIGAIYLVVYIILFIIISATGQTAASTQFVYAEGALLGFVVLYILICWIGVWGYFAYCLYLTWREEAQFDKRLFYLIFGIGCTVWFILPALFNFISMAIAEWYRPRVVDAFQLTVTFIGVVALVVLLWPSRVEKYFRISSNADFSGSTPEGAPAAESV